MTVVMHVAVVNHLVDTAAVHEVAKDGLGVQSGLVQVNALGLRHKYGAAHACIQQILVRGIFGPGFQVCRSCTEHVLLQLITSWVE